MRLAADVASEHVAGRTQVEHRAEVGLAALDEHEELCAVALASSHDGQRSRR